MQLRMGGPAGTDIAQGQDDSTQQENHREGSKRQGKRASKRKLQDATVRESSQVGVQSMQAPRQHVYHQWDVFYLIPLICHPWMFDII